MAKEKQKEKISIKNLKIIWDYLKEDKLKIMLYVLLEAVAYAPSILTPYIWGMALEALTLNETINFYKYMVIHTAIFVIAFGVISILTQKIYNYLEIKFIKNVSKDLYKKMNELPARAFEEIGVGEFVNRLSGDPDTVISLLSRLLNMICKFIVAVIVMVICIKSSWLITLEIVIFMIIMGFISGNFFPKIKNSQEKIKEESDKYSKAVTENITGIREIKSLGIKEKTKKDTFKVIDKLYGHSEKIRNSEDIYYSLNNLIYFILQGAILMTSGYLFFKGQFTYSLFVMIESYIWRVDTVVETLSEFGVNINKVMISLKRIDEILNNKLYKSEEFGKESLDNPKGIIEFKEVTFRYTEKESDTLNKLNLKIEPNKKIAIVGRSGNGKSTIFNLLLRYFDATSGTITIDGHDIKNLTESSLRKTISIIRQSPFLFNMSIFDNFKIVKEDVTLDEVREVCKKAYIDDYIMGLPDKYDTVIGEGGINLSGGQKQRIAIARTLLLNTKIILFDEATSALDNESQEYIKKTIDELIKDHTVVIVAHRLSTIVDADIINIIDKGTLVGSGKHASLLKLNDVYKNLYNADIKIE